jgi:teichuronic acid biosynthesis glycosyltransferase TuaC
MTTPRAIRLLTFTSLYPSSAQPARGLFVERRLLRIVATGTVDATVIAPMPWFPLMSGRADAFPTSERREHRDGVTVHHPRFLSLPGLGMYLAPIAMFLGAWRLARQIARSDDCDIVDAHYFYPDGVAAALIALLIRRPLVVSARGTDINLLPSFAIPRRLIKWVIRRSDRIIAVSRALKERLVELGAPASRVDVLPNGVDLDDFCPLDKHHCRAMLKLPDTTILLSVGNLIDGKGHHLVIEALSDLPEAVAVIVGDGAMRDRLAQLARQFGVADRVLLVGAVARETLVKYYSAADMLVLASVREGMPNVVLEALACGLPVVATDVGGVAEVLEGSDCGILMAERSASAIVSSVRAMQSDYPDRLTTRAYASNFSWSSTVRGQTELYATVARRQGSP